MSQGYLCINYSADTVISSEDTTAERSLQGEFECLSELSPPTSLASWWVDEQGAGSPQAGDSSVQEMEQQLPLQVSSFRAGLCADRMRPLHAAAGCGPRGPRDLLSTALPCSPAAPQPDVVNIASAVLLSWGCHAALPAPLRVLTMRTLLSICSHSGAPNYRHPQP